MLPQLVTSTFPSQVFWVVLGFFCVYFFINSFATPRLKVILDEREKCINESLKSATTLKTEAEKLKKDAAVSLSEAQKEILGMEKRLLADFELKSRKEKSRLTDEMTANMKAEMSSLCASSREVFDDVSSDVDELLNLIMDKMEKTNSVRS